ncbi:MAG: DNA alkylation repair protein [Planctomycetota bacterium]|jgi:3-methyladenine DNA glycosylase AlkD
MWHARDVQADLKKAARPERCEQLQRFFKTRQGEYAEGDRFLGVYVPDVRKIARQYQDLSHKEIDTLLRSPIHEERLTALMILVEQFGHGDKQTQKRIYDYYLSRTRYVNNWDLVDLTAPKIVGAWLHGKSKTPLGRLARSTNLWERRIAIIATGYDIKHDDFTATLEIAKMLLNDKHDLIHKAVGWMLRDSWSSTPTLCPAPCCVTPSNAFRDKNENIT